MNFVDDPDLADVMKEEITRGTRHQQKATTLAERKRLFSIYRKIAASDFTEAQVAKALRDVGLKTTDRYQKILKAWRDYSGKYR